MRLLRVLLLAWAVFAGPDPSARAKAIVAQLTLEEKVGLLTGVGGNYSGNLAAIPRLSVPGLGMNDGPQGFRAPAEFAGTTTAFPCALSVAAGWDGGNAYAFGTAMGAEFAGKGAGMMLGPAMNVARLPTNGRNFEYISGEDGALGAVMAAAVVRGVQSQGVVANAKHYVQNNQEYQRSTVDSIVDERTHVEVYLPPFEAAVEAGVGSVMCR
jgi:beta-glucosidase